MWNDRWPGYAKDREKDSCYHMCVCRWDGEDEVEKLGREWEDELRVRRTTLLAARWGYEAARLSTPTDMTIVTSWRGDGKEIKGKEAA